MIPNKQLICSNTHGDCYRACLTSILEIPNSPELLPDAGDPECMFKILKFLEELGLYTRYETKAFWDWGYWIASVPSLNFEGVTHAIVMHSTEVAFDPSPKLCYNIGEYLGNKGIVKGGHLLEVIDPSKLRKLVELQDKYRGQRREEATSQA